MASDDPVNRRRFFREGLRELLRPFADAVAPVERVLSELERLEGPRATTQPGGGIVPPGVWLRPPGALAEARFAETCDRSGECVNACPVQAIRIDASASRGRGLPYIAADRAACAVCDGLQCMSRCPSGALRPTPLVDIRMGTAVWREAACVRSRGEDCAICVEHCPLGAAAIELIDGRVQVHPRGCIGCGVCQQDCPTDPRSIVVIPVAARQA